MIRRLLARYHALDRRVRALLITAALLSGAAIVTFGHDLRLLLAHRQGTWVAEGGEGTLTDNAKADSQRWEEVDRDFQRGLLLMHAGDSQGAAVLFASALKRDPGLVEVRVNLGFCLLDLDAWHEALLQFVTAIQFKPEQANAYYGAALVYYELGDIEGALGNMRTFVHLAGDADPFQARAMARIVLWEEELRIFRAGEPSELDTFSEEPP